MATLNMSMCLPWPGPCKSEVRGQGIRTAEQQNKEPQNARLPCIAIGVKVINVTIPSLYGILHEQRKGIAGRSKYLNTS